MDQINLYPRIRLQTKAKTNASNIGAKASIEGNLESPIAFSVHLVGV